MLAQQSSKRTTPVQTWMDNQEVAELDAYRRSQKNPPTRAEAIRQLCALAIRASGRAMRAPRRDYVAPI
jgi:hypothetical protein